MFESSSPSCVDMSKKKKSKEEEEEEEEGVHVS
jgi:hypothetical protein